MLKSLGDGVFGVLVERLEVLVFIREVYGNVVIYFDCVGVGWFFE